MLICAECVWGDMSPRGRKAALSLFSANNVDIATSVSLLNAGLDVPDDGRGSAV